MRNAVPIKSTDLMTPPQSTGLAAPTGESVAGLVARPMTETKDDVAGLVGDFASIAFDYRNRVPTTIGGEDMSIDENARLTTLDGRPQSMSLIRSMRVLPHIPLGVRELLVKLANEVDYLRNALSTLAAERNGALNLATRLNVSGALEVTARRASEARATALEAERNDAKADALRLHREKMEQWTQRIEAEAQLAKVREALEPFARAADRYSTASNLYLNDGLRLSDLRRAREVLRALPAPADGRGDQMLASASCPQEPAPGEQPIGWSYEFLGYDGEWGRFFKFHDEGEPASGGGAIIRNVTPLWRNI